MVWGCSAHQKRTLGLASDYPGSNLLVIFSTASLAVFPSYLKFSCTLYPIKPSKSETCVEDWSKSWKTKRAERADGAYVSSLEASPLEETRYALFSINLHEDLVQDLVVNYSCADLEPVRKTYQNAGEIEKTYRLITGEQPMPK